MDFFCKIENLPLLTQQLSATTISNPQHVTDDEDIPANHVKAMDAEDFLRVAEEMTWRDVFINFRCVAIFDVDCDPEDDGDDDDVDVDNDSS